MAEKCTDVVVDTDFLTKIFEIQQRDPIELISRILEALNQKALLHTLVYQNEFRMHKSKVDNLVIQDHMHIKCFNEFLVDQDAKDYYVFMVDQLYQKLKMQPITVILSDIFTDWVAQQSLGEVHSLAMCLMLDCPFFYSDDDDAKNLVEFIREFMPSLKVQNRKELVEELKLTQLFKRNELKLITHK